MLSLAWHKWLIKNDLSFFGYEHDYEKSILSIRHGGLQPRQFPYVAGVHARGRQKNASPAPEKKKPTSAKPVNPESLVTPLDNSVQPEQLVAAQAQAQTALEEEVTLDVLQDEVGDSGSDRETGDASATPDQSHLWAKSRLVVVDPFIRVKVSLSASSAVTGVAADVACRIAPARATP